MLTVERTQVLEGPVVRVRVAKDAISGEVEGIKYLRTNRGLKGGGLHIFVHSGDENLRGREVVGQAIVMLRKLSDGRKYLYVDVKPVEGETETHRIHVCSTAEAKRVRVVQGSHQFLLPEPLSGALLLLPADQKVVSEEVETVSDPQLEKKKREGWSIAEDRGATVILWKMKGDVRKTITHHRPKR